MKDVAFYTEQLRLIRPDNSYKAALCFCFFSPTAEFGNYISRLHGDERTYYSSLRYEKRIRTYLLGRLSAKEAVGCLTGEKDLSRINIQPGVFRHPVVRSSPGNVQVSITHCDDLGAAVAFPEAHPMGIDLEKIDPGKNEVLEGQSSGEERQMIRTLPLSYESGLTLLWTAKEALSKVLKTGLMTPFSVFQVSELETGEDLIEGRFENFAQYKFFSFPVGDHMCSLVLPAKTDMTLEPGRLRESLSFIKEAEQLCT